jgi:uncharacterized protein YjcR
MARGVALDVAEFRRLWLAGVRGNKIAQVLEIHPNTVTQMARSLGFARRGPKQIDVPLFFKLWHAGVHTQEIARQIGCSASRVSDYRIKYGFPARERKPLHRASDPTPAEIEQRKRECRERHFAEKRAEKWEPKA